jgi:hypothetical protein
MMKITAMIGIIKCLSNRNEEFTCQQKRLHQSVTSRRPDASQDGVERRLQQRPLPVNYRRPLLIRVLDRWRRHSEGNAELTHRFACGIA